MSQENKLPADPEEMNDQRAEWADEAIRKFQRETSCEDDEMLGDLLCNLMHWADRNNNDFEAALIRARSHYREETDGTE